VTGYLFRAVGVCLHALHGHAGRWLVNEKGAVASAARLPGVPPDLLSQVGAIHGRVGTEPAELHATLDAAADLVRDTVTACRH